MAYDIPTRFHKVWSRHLREIERTKMCGRIIIIRIIITRYHMIWRIITWLPIKKTMTIINLEEQNLLGNQSVPESEDFCILAAILDSKWSLYGAACLTSCKYPFPLKSFHFWIFNNLFWFYIGSHFEMAAILKILKTKSTILSDYLFLCQVSKGSAVRSEFSIFCTLVTIATAAILNLFNPQKLPHTTVDIPT